MLDIWTLLRHARTFLHRVVISLNYKSPQDSGYISPTGVTWTKPSTARSWHAFYKGTKSLCGRYQFKAGDPTSRMENGGDVLAQCQLCGKRVYGE